MTETTKKLPKKFILRIVIEAGVLRQDGNLDVITTENMIGVTANTKPSKVLAKVKTQLIEAMQKGRDHVPSVVHVPKQSIILPD